MLLLLPHNSCIAARRLHHLETLLGHHGRIVGGGNGVGLTILDDRHILLSRRALLRRIRNPYQSGSRNKANQDEIHLHETVLDIEDSSMSNITSTAATAPITKLNKLKTQF